MTIPSHLTYTPLCTISSHTSFASTSSASPTSSPNHHHHHNNNNTNIPISPQWHLSKPLDAILPLLGPSNTDIYMQNSLSSSLSTNHNHDDRSHLDSEDASSAGHHHQLSSDHAIIGDADDIKESSDAAIGNHHHSNNTNTRHLLTNDGATFLMHLSQLNQYSSPTSSPSSSPNPTSLNLDGAILLKELSCSMDQMAGDGTTGIVCLVRDILLRFSQLGQLNYAVGGGDSGAAKRGGSIIMTRRHRNGASDPVMWNRFHVRDAIMRILQREGQHEEVSQRQQQQLEKETHHQGSFSQFSQQGTPLKQHNHPPQQQHHHNHPSLLDQVLQSVTIKNWSPQKTQYHLVKTTLTSKISSFMMPDMIQLAIDAMKATNGKYERATRNDALSRNCVDIIKQVGPPVLDSSILGQHMIRVRVFEKFGYSAATAVNATTTPQRIKCAILQFSLNLPSNRHASSRSYTSTAQVDKAIREENAYSKRLVGLFRKHKFQVIFLQENHKGRVTNTTKRLLEKFKIQVIVLRQSEVQYLMSCLNSVTEVSECGDGSVSVSVNGNGNGDSSSSSSSSPSPSSSSKPSILSLTSLRQLQTLDPKKTTPHQQSFSFHIDSFQEYQDFLCIQSEQHFCDSVCLRLCAPTQLSLDEVERALHDALKVLEVYYQDPRLVYGGGCAEMALCSRLQQFATSDGKSTSLPPPSIQRAMETLGDVFQSIPRLLAANCGLNPDEVIQQFHKSHAAGQFHCGLLVHDEEASFCDFELCGNSQHDDALTDKLREPSPSPSPSSPPPPPVELYHNKKTQIVMALETAWQLLKIDEIFKWRVEA